MKTLSDYVKSLPQDHDVLADKTLMIALSGRGYSDENIYDHVISTASLTNNLFKPDDEFNHHFLRAYEACRKLIETGKADIPFEVVTNCRSSNLEFLIQKCPNGHPAKRLFESRDYMWGRMWDYERRLVTTCNAIGKADKWDEVEALLK